MTRPRKEPITVSQEEQADEIDEGLSRRRLMQLAGAAGTSFVAGCGGGGGDQSPTATATEAAATDSPTATVAQDTPTPTETEEDTPTPTETEEDTPTPTDGEVEFVDQILRDVTSPGTNFEKFQVNEWNAESGFIPGMQRMPLSQIENSVMTGASVESTLDVVFPQAAKSFELDTENLEFTINLHEGLSWGDGTPYTAEHLLMHKDIIKAQIELGESQESTLPISMEAVDDHTVTSTLLPGNPVLRMITAIFQGTLRRITMTHPEHHRPFVESIRSATTNSETQSALQELFSATLPPDVLPDFALGPFKATDWNPSRMIFEAREDFPWGLDYNEVDRMFSGLRKDAIGEETGLVVPATTGKKDWISRLGSRQKWQQFDQENWRLWTTLGPPSNRLDFSPKSEFGQQTEKARTMRQAVGYLFNSKETAAVNDLGIAYEQSTGFVRGEDFRRWIGNDRFLGNWTNYGHKETGYVFEEKGNQSFRDAGFERNKNGVWVDTADGEPLSATYIAEPTRIWGLTRPVIDNVAEQLNGIGIKTSAKIIEGEQWENRIQNFEFDFALQHSQCAMSPHPFMGYREDCGLGSPQGLPAGISSWDWRNGYRRVKVPAPVGNPEGELTEFDYDTLVKKMVQIQDAEKMKQRVRTLSWILNQWLPGIYLTPLTAYSVRKTSKINIQEGFPSILYRRPNFHLSAGYWQAY